jgi:hypothetical protein
VSGVGVVYESNLREVEEAAMAVLEVDGISVDWNAGQLHRVGMFSVKEDVLMTEDAYTSDDLSMVQDMEWFYETSPLAFGAFDCYEEARFWSHP